jgi:hypothetical protein
MGQLELLSTVPKMKKKPLRCIAGILLCTPSLTTLSPPFFLGGEVNPYEADWTPTLAGRIDRLIGAVPEAKAYWSYREMKTKQRRAALIKELLESEARVDYWTLKWSDLLRIKTEFPINLWPNEVQAYHKWIEASIRANTGYDVLPGSC